MCISVVNSYI